jgi:hypothetical protein
MDLESARCASDERKSNWNDCFEEYLEKTLKCNVPWPKTKSVSTPQCDNGDNIYIYALHKDCWKKKVIFLTMGQDKLISCSSDYSMRLLSKHSTLSRYFSTTELKSPYQITHIAICQKCHL